MKNKAVVLGENIGLYMMTSVLSALATDLHHKFK